jgi:thioredoxin 1
MWRKVSNLTYGVLASVIVVGLGAATPSIAGPMPAIGNQPPVQQALPYDELADAGRDVQSALQQASGQGKLVLLVFGANWCPDCRNFQSEMDAVELGSTLAENYIVVKIDVGRFKRNLDIAQKFGVSIRRGIPALGVLNGDGSLVLAADGRKVEELRRGTPSAAAKFFEDIISKSRS